MILNRKYLFLSLIIIPIGLLGQNKKIVADTFSISITQQILPGQNWIYIYKITPGSIKIFKSKDLNSSSFKPIRRLFKLKLNVQQTDSLKIILSEIDVINLGESYSGKLLDGVNWTFDFLINNKNKTIGLDNYYLPELGRLLDFVNMQLPDNQRYISFDIFDTRQKFNE